MHINTVCLCGSTRFKDEFDRTNRELTKLGISVLTISFAAEKDEAGNEREPHVKELLDLVHFNKILRADAVVIVGGGYVGFSTAREILWARMQGKPIFDGSSEVLLHHFNNYSLFDQSYYWVERAQGVLRKLAETKS